MYKSERFKKKKGATSHGGPPYHREFYLQEPNLVLTVKFREKSPHASSRGWGEATILKYARAFYS